MLRALCVLLSFASLSSAADFRPNLGPGHERITVTCGEVTVLLRRASQWTPGRFDFRGRAMTTEKSAYGTVFSFPGTGFIGTAHLENEPEDLQSLRFFVDGNLVENPAAEIESDTFRLERVSRIRGILLTGTLEIRDNRIHETSTVRTDQDLPLKLVYHFMHAWVPTASRFLAGTDAAPGEEVAGELVDTAEAARKFHIQKPVDWFAIFDPASDQFAVSRLQTFPEEAKPFSRLWNVPGTYRKYYLQNFSDATVPAGFEGTWEMVTAFGGSSPENWETEARALSEQLRQLPIVRTAIRSRHALPGFR